jgi:hypothetical protein
MRAPARSNWARPPAPPRARDGRRLPGLTCRSGFSRCFLGAEVAVPLNQLTARPDEVEGAVQQALAGQAFWSKSSEQELMQ